MDHKKPNGLMEGSPLGVSKDFQRIRQGTKASAAELRQFMKTMRGKSPQEMLGVVAQSGLVQGVILATLGTLVLVAVMTVLPYGLSQMAVAESPAKAEEETESVEEAPASTAETAATAANPATGGTPTVDATRTLDALGESEVKDSDPGKNPLDNLDDLLEIE